MPNDFFAPGIPTSYAKEGKTRFTNDDLSQRQKFSITKEKSPSMLALDGPSPIDEILRQAHQTLDDTQGTQIGLNMAARSARGDMPARSEDFAPAHETYRDVAHSTARAGQLAGAVLAPFTGGASLAALELPASAYLAADEGVQAGQDVAAGNIGSAGGNALSAALDGLAIRPGYRSLMGKPKAFMEGVSPRVTGQGAELPYKAMLAEEPSASMRALHTPTPEVDLTDEWNALHNGHDAAGAFDDSGRMVAPPQAQPDAAYLAHQASSVGKNGAKPSAVFAGMQETGNGEAPIALFHVAGGPQHGSTVTADTLQSLGIPVPPTSGAPASNPRMKSLIQSLFGDKPSPSVSRMTAQEALAGGDETANRAVLFGGATSQTEGTHGEYVRPKHRYPIGSGAPRVTPRDQNVVWNP